MVGLNFSSRRNKKAGAAKYLEVFDHAGLLVNETPAGGEMLFTSRPTIETQMFI